MDVVEEIARERRVRRCRAWLNTAQAQTVTAERWPFATYAASPIACYGGDGVTLGTAPDRSYHSVLADVDLERALLSIADAFLRDAGTWARTHPRQRGWAREFNIYLHHHHHMRYCEWLDQVQSKPFDALLDRTADAMAEQLGQGWW